MNRSLLSMNILLAAVLVAPVVQSSPQSPATDRPLHCYVDGSDDLFLLYPHMLSAQSERYSIYTLMGGLTVAVVDRAEGRFNRLTSLNLRNPSERIQFFTGRCHTGPESN